MYDVRREIITQMDNIFELFTSFFRFYKANMRHHRSIKTLSELNILFNISNAGHKCNVKWMK